MKKAGLLFFVLGCLSITACDASTYYDVVDPVNPVSGITILDTSTSGESDVTSFSLSAGEQKTLQAKVLPESLKNISLTWHNSNSSIVGLTSYEQDGSFYCTVKGLTNGNATITAIAGMSYSTCYVTVGGGGSAVTVKSVTLNTTSLNLEAGGDTYQLVATVDSNSSSLIPVSWVSSNPEVATVNDNGVVNPLKKGSTNIIATAGGKSASCFVYVKNPGEQSSISVSLDKENATLTVGDNLQLNASVSGAAGLSVLWQSNNTSVASVDQSGLVKALGAGTATITASVSKDEESAVAACTIIVNKSADESEYEASLANWSKNGHLYIHYLRPEADYDNWAVWIWQKVPQDLEGSLWGATKWASTALHEKVPHCMSESWMSVKDVTGGGDAATPYIDAHGQICDIDLTRTDIVDGVEGIASPLWPSRRVGFLLVDQTNMNGESHWVSDGGIESYIRDFDELMPDLNRYLHIYCIQDSVSEFSYSSGDTAKVNPTVADTTGQYVSKNDIDNLKRDLYGNVSTSESFLRDQPGIGYQIFVPSFADSNGDGTGDIQGIIQHLDYLNDLGVKCLWLTPIQESGSYHGYDVTDYYKIDSKFGTIEDYQELIYKAHKMGMKVLMDMVINHTSKSNVLFGKSQRAETEVVNGKTINYRDMYLWKFKGDQVRKWDGDEDYYKENDKQKARYINVNVEDMPDWYRDGSSNYYYFGKFGSGMAELNYSCQATRDYMTDMCKYWLSFGLDGFRLDAIKHIYLESELDPATSAMYSSDYKTYDVGYRTYYDNQLMKEVTSENDYSYDRDLNVMFWKEFAGSIKSAYPNCFLVGENFDGWNQRIAPFYQSMDSQFDFSTYYHFNEMGEASITDDIKTTLGYNDAQRPNHINGAFTSNHDVARLLNHAGSTTLNVHSVEINDSNKVVANQRARYYSAVTLLSPGLSWIYYGDELGMSGNTTDKVKDSSGNLVDDHGNNLDRWYRQPMRWCSTQGDEQVVKYKFSGLEVTWDNYNRTIKNVHEQLLDNNSMLNLYKEIGRIKASINYPTYGRIQWGGSCGGIEGTGAFQVKDNNHTANIFFNNTGNAITPPAQDVYGFTFLGGSYGASISNVPAYGFVVVYK